MSEKRVIYTIGHSTHPSKEFIAILQAYKVRRLVDIRTIPKSRHNPQFNQDRLQDKLKSAGITYVHLPGLGGLRHTTQDSPNQAWTNLSFRGYADYMQTPEFEQSLQKLLKTSANKPTVLMCAEAVPWRCHRSLVGDALLIRDIAVVDIFSTTNSKPHTLTPWARVEGLKLTYPKAIDIQPSACSS